MKIVIAKHFEVSAGEYLDMEEVQADINARNGNIVIEVDSVMYIIPIEVFRIFNMTENNKK